MGGGGCHSSQEADRPEGEGKAFQGLGGWIQGGGWENWRFYFQTTGQVYLKVLRGFMGEYSLLISGIFAPETGAEGALRKGNMGLSCPVELHKPVYIYWLGCVFIQRPWTRDLPTNIGLG